MKIKTMAIAVLLSVAGLPGIAAAQSQWSAGYGQDQANNPPPGFWESSRGDGGHRGARRRGDDNQFQRQMENVGGVVDSAVNTAGRMNRRAQEAAAMGRAYEFGPYGDGRIQGGRQGFVYEDPGQRSSTVTINGR